MLGGPGLFRAYRLQRPVAELTVVAESFHLKPLLRILQSADRYHVLGLNQQGVTLFEGNRDALDPVELIPEVASSIAEALEEAQDKSRAETWTFDAGRTRALHGHTSGTSPADHARERFFRAVDRAILAHYSRPSGLPLLLAALPENQARFRQISRNPLLMERGIEVHPDALSIEALRDQAWQAVEPRYLARLAGLTEMFGVARSRDLGTDDLEQAMKAAVAGRVATLLVEADRHIPGQVDAATGGIEVGDLVNPGVDDLLDDLGESVLRQGGQVVVVPAERMPTRTGLAAIFRF